MEKCCICFENKKTAPIPCTCVANVCETCWNSDNNTHNQTCVLCKKPLPLSISWSLKSAAPKDGALWLLGAFCMACLAAYLTLCVYQLTNGSWNWGISFTGAAFALIIDNFISPRIISFATTPHIVHGCTLAVLHFCFLLGYPLAFSYNTFSFWICFPGCYMILTTLIEGLFSVLLALAFFSGLRIDPIPASAFVS